MARNPADRGEALREQLVARHPWLARTIDEEEYLPPSYYSRLLKPYCSGGRSDLTILESFLSGVSPTPSRVLELGCGSGRATATTRTKWPTSDLTVVDLSRQMLASLPSHLMARRVRSDICDYLRQEADEPSFDLILSLWAFSHSVHLCLGREHRSEVPPGTGASAIRRMMTKRLGIGGRFFIVHFDSLSQEQRVAMPQWARIDPIFSEVDQQSPSFRLLSRVLGQLDEEGVATTTQEHFNGDPIEYTGLEAALETYFNFHLEGRLSRLEPTELSCAIEEVSKALLRHQCTDGRIRVQPAWFVFSGERLR